MKIILSPRQRFELAALFVNDKLVMTDLAEVKTFNRTRLALRLSPVMDLIIRRQPILASIAHSVEPAGFELTTAASAFILAKIVPLALGNAYLVMLLGSFFEACELGGDDPEDLPPPGPEDWAGPTTPAQITIEHLRAALLLPAETSVSDVLARVEDICTRALDASS